MLKHSRDGKPTNQHGAGLFHVWRPGEIALSLIIFNKSPPFGDGTPRVSRSGSTDLGSALRGWTPFGLPTRKAPGPEKGRGVKGFSLTFVIQVGISWFEYGGLTPSLGPALSVSEKWTTNPRARGFEAERVREREVGGAALHLPAAMPHVAWHGKAELWRFHSGGSSLRSDLPEWLRFSW